MKRMSRLLGSLALPGLLLAAGCAGPAQLGGDPQLRVLDTRELPVPDRIDLTGSTRAYYVGPFDRLVIDVYGMPDLSEREIQVDASGRISFPLAGVVNVSGLTPAEVEERLIERLRSAYVRNPMVTVNLKETLSRVVTIEGQVRKPGIYPVIGEMTLLRTIAKAEGTDEFTKLDDVVIFRTVNGQRYAALYDLSAIRRGVYGDPEVFANDVITVGDSRSRRLFRDIMMVLPAAITPIVIGLDRLSK
jgi:polysaccharide biosynthesis/export protein